MRGEEDVERGVIKERQKRERERERERGRERGGEEKRTNEGRRCRERRS